MGPLWGLGRLDHQYDARQSVAFLDSILRGYRRLHGDICLSATQGKEDGASESVKSLARREDASVDRDVVANLFHRVNQR